MCSDPCTHVLPSFDAFCDVSRKNPKREEIDGARTEKALIDMHNFYAGVDDELMELESDKKKTSVV